jgi:dihydrofolate reductase
MRQVILQIDITLDGFVAGSQGELDWVTADEEMNHDANALLGTADTVLLGRMAYQLFADYWPFADTTASSTESHIAQRLIQASKVVFSKTLDTVAWGSWNNARLAKGSVMEEILEMKAQPGKDLVLYAGAEIVSTFIRLGLVDHYRLRVHPVVLGSGKPIFTDSKDRINLKLLQAKPYQNGVVLLDYQPSNT